MAAFHMVPATFDCDHSLRLTECLDRTPQTAEPATVTQHLQRDAVKGPCPRRHGARFLLTAIARWPPTSASGRRSERRHARL